MWKYLGGGFLPPLPARDLSDQEAKQFGLQKVKDSNLYKHVKDKVFKIADEQGGKRSVKHGRN